MSVSACVAIKKYPLPRVSRTVLFTGTGYRLPRPGTVLPGGRFFQVNTDIDSQPGIPLRVFLELFFAPVTAEVIFVVLMSDGKFCIFFINDHETDGIGCHCVYHVPVQESWLFPYEVSPFITGSASQRYRTGASGFSSCSCLMR